GNGTAGNFATADNIVFTADITPAADGSVTVDIAAAIAQDLAGNDNEAATHFSALYDGTAPTVAITSTANTPTNSNPIPVTITFSEEVTGFDISDLTIGNGTAGNFATADDIIYTVDVAPTADGSVTVDIAAAIAQDLVGNDNEAATQLSITYDGSVTQVACRDITVQLDANGAATIEATQIDNASSDNFGIAARTIDINTFGCDNIGANNVTLTITDANGNSASCVAVVTVEDIMSPVVITQDIAVVWDANGQASITPADIDNGSTDNCGIANQTLDVTTFSAPITSTTVTLTVTDVVGNSASGIALVTFGKVGQTILFEPLADKKVGEDPIRLKATVEESGLPVTFSIVTEPPSGVASLIDDMIIIEGAGGVVVTASQAGNDIFSAAADVSQSFEILANELFLPTLFTPNGDQTNDRFIIRGGGNVASIQFSIFDRDNNLVFSSDSLTDLFQSGWDGTNGGTEQPQGAYIWVIRGSFTDGSPVLINGKDTGIISLAR
ncbi:MAG: Ig-like domain-containing protein, partial [Cyclobacteriaceae bacterium]